MKNKPNLVLTEKDLLEGANNPDRDFSVKFKADLITVLEHMIENKALLKIDLLEFERKEDCGTYRCICGWWAYWLDIPIRYKNGSLTKRFNKTLNSVNIWPVFKSKNKLLYDSYHNRTFFGDGSTDSLPKRLELAKALEVA